MNRLRIVLLGLVAAFAGCGGGTVDIGPTVPVSGRVTFNAGPVTRGAVSFRPDREKGNLSTHEPVSPIDEQGNYDLHIGEHRGAPIGWYKVVVVSMEAADPQYPFKPIRRLVPVKYALPSTSDAAIEVVEKAAGGAYDLELTGTIDPENVIRYEGLPEDTHISELPP